MREQHNKEVGEMMSIPVELNEKSKIFVESARIKKKQREEVRDNNDISVLGSLMQDAQDNIEMVDIGREDKDGVVKRHVYVKVKKTITGGIELKVMKTVQAFKKIQNNPEEEIEGVVDSLCECIPLFCVDAPYNDAQTWHNLYEDYIGLADLGDIFLKVMKPYTEEMQRIKSFRSGQVGQVK